MAQTLRTGNFSLRALPQVPRIDPAQFDAGIRDLIAINDAAMQLPARLEGVRSVQRQGRLERALEPQTIELAQQRAAQELELGPYDTAAKKRKATQALDEPGGTNLYYDEAGNLVQEQVIVETDPITGEKFNVSVPNIVKTAAQVAQERETASALTTVREANARAAEERAKAATTTAEAAMKRAERPLGGSRGRSVTRELKDRLGRSLGIVIYQFDETGKLVGQQMTTPDGQTVDVPVPGAEDGEQTALAPLAPAQATTPATTTGGTVATTTPAAEVTALASQYATPQALLAAVRAKQITTAQAREIAKLNKFE